MGCALHASSRTSRKKYIRDQIISAIGNNTYNFLCGLEEYTLKEYLSSHEIKKKNGFQIK